MLLQASTAGRECSLIVVALAYVLLPKELNAQQADCTPCVEAQLLATEAYLYFFPMVQSYNVFFAQTLGQIRNGLTPNVNSFRHLRELINADSASVVTPNDDTLYSSSWLDLRAEPMVLSVPEVPQVPYRRYYSVQIVDGYTHNVEILGVRTRGSDSGDYLIAESSWKGEVPQSINETIYIEGDYAYVLARIVVHDSEDYTDAWAIQNHLILTPLSEFSNRPPPSGFLKPLTSFFTEVGEAATLDFFESVNIILQYIRINPTEKWLFEQFERIGIKTGQTPYPPVDMSECLHDDIAAGIAYGRKLISTYTDLEAEVANGWRVSIDPPRFGNRSVMQGRYLDRAFGARSGIYGLDPDEAYYPGGVVDTDGDDLDGSVHNYTLTIHPNQVPDVKGFWSITMYNERFRFVDNAIDRYSIGDRTHNLHLQNKTLTVIIQKDMPMLPEEVDNWLPAPDGRFGLVARLYWPTPETFKLPYLPPGVEKSNTIY